MFEFASSIGQWLVTLFALGLAYWTYKSDKDESKKRKVRKEQEKALLDDVMFLTTTRVKFEKHLWTILDKVASYKIQSVIITDEKEIPQSVLLPYAEYKILQECYDKEEAKELAPLIEERMKNNANKDNFISHEEMMKIIDEKRARKHTEEKKS
jgi:hypothetical protein